MENLYYIEISLKTQKYVLIINQRWKKCNTRQIKGIVDIEKPDIHLHFHIQEKFTIQLDKLAALHFYQKMAASSWTKDGQQRDGGTHVM